MNSLFLSSDYIRQRKISTPIINNRSVTCWSRRSRLAVCRLTKVKRKQEISATSQEISYRIKAARVGFSHMKVVITTYGTEA